jgi:hypothetical protein
MVRPCILCEVGARSRAAADIFCRQFAVRYLYRNRDIHGCDLVAIAIGIVLERKISPVPLITGALCLFSEV